MISTEPAKHRLLIVHPALAPYRVDQFNRLARQFDLTVVFLNDNVWNHPFDQGQLQAQAEFKYCYLLKGLQFRGRVFRWGLLRLIRSLQPDIIVGYEFSFTTQILVVLKRLGLLRQPIGTTVDDSLDMCTQVQSRTRALARLIVARRLNYLIVLSEAVARYYASTYGIADKRIIVSPILQDPARLRRRADLLDATAQRYAEQHGLHGRKVVLFVGRIIAEKGLTGFLDAIEPVFRERPGWLLVLVGDGAERPALEAFLLRAGLKSRILMPGRFEDIALHAWYLCASGFILPSVYEPFGAVVNEALIFGLPVMCSNLAGSASLVGPASGRLFNPLDAAAARQTFTEFLDTLTTMTEFRTDARPSLTGAQFEAGARQWEKLLGC